ncbi:MAG TPA: vWA domain-containing protein [Thermoanaerobaculia bacterium]|jgi:hypothetical protein|nr:vWA domain-containing protein [Thermoanaerobaculia bacterium]
MKHALVLLAFLGLALAGAAHASGRNVVVLIDTSGSMLQNDRPRYTVQLSQIIGDLLDDSDELTVVRLGGLGFFCWEGPSSLLSLRLDAGNRAGFKRGLDRLISYGGGNAFAAPIRTAMQILTLNPARKRMLLMIADSGGLDPCEGPLTKELVKLHDSGAMVAAINIGSSAGAFDRNPAFDFTTAAENPEELVKSVAEVYQRFLGARKVQTGRVQSGGVEVEIDALVREAFLVVAADGPLSRLEQGPGNPGAKDLDLDYRGGGQTQGLDGRTRGYRIVRFTRPGPGRWRLRVPGLASDAAWMLLQEDTLGVRLISPGKVPEGTESVLEAELYDTETGQPVRDLSKVPGAAVSIQIDGQEVPLRDDGTGGDRKAGDGVFSVSRKFQGRGKRDLPIRLRTQTIDRRVKGELEVVEAGWRLVPPPPSRAEVGTPMKLTVGVEPLGSPAAPRVPPERIDVKVRGGTQAALHADAPGSHYEGSWTPPTLGTQHLELVPVGGSLAAPATTQVEVVGSLEFGPPTPVRFRRLHGGGQGTAALDLATAKVKGSFDLEVTSGFDVSGGQLEMETAAGWVPLGRKPVAIRLEAGGARSWPLRLRVGSCPAACSPSAAHSLVVAGVGADGKPRRTEIPLQVEIVPDPWLKCWWPVLAAVALAILAVFVIYGFWSPSRFAPRLAVQISPEIDMSEGFAHPVRGTRGSGSGFYRDAMIYVGNFELTRKPAGALARLRAHRSQVRIRPMNGTALWRQNLDGEWDPLAADETTVRPGVIHRNDLGTLYFEVRNR